METMFVEGKSALRVRKLQRLCGSMAERSISLNVERYGSSARNIVAAPYIKL